MAINLQAYKLAANELSSATKENAFVQAVQDALNNLGNATYGSFAAGQIFDPAKIKQSGATNGQAIMWNGTQYAPATPPGSVWTLISDSNVASDVASVSFTGISNAFKHLVLVCYLRSDRASAEDDLGVRFNADTAANYDSYSVKFSGNNPNTTASETFTATSAKIVNGLVGNSAGANLFSTITLSIPNYAGTANQKTCHALVGKKVGTSAGNLHVIEAMGAWRSTAAVSRIDLLPVGGGANFKNGYRATLYGL